MKARTHCRVEAEMARNNNSPGVIPRGVSDSVQQMLELRNGETDWEQSLVTALRSRDSDALQEMMRMYGPRLRRIAAGMLHNAEDAEDVVQSSLWKAYSNVSSFRCEAALYTWLVSITLRESLTLLRSRKVRMLSLDDQHTLSEVEMVSFRTQPSPEQITITKDAARVCMGCLENFFPGVRNVLVMRLIEDRTNAEIAARLSISINTVKIRYHRGLKQLRRMANRVLEPSL